MGVGIDIGADEYTVCLVDEDADGDVDGTDLAGLALEAEEVDRERQVILEEVAMYEDDPWTALEQRVMDALFPDHPYGRPVLGTRRELAATGGAELAAFHRRLYRPERAVLAVAGDLEPGAAEAVRRTFESVAPRSGDLRAKAPREQGPKAAPPERLQRLERRRGQVPRLLLALPAPAADHPDHPRLRLALALLAGGRSSRLYRFLVDEGQLAAWVAEDLAETLDPGVATLSLEVVPGVEPERVEAALLAELAELRRRPPSEGEIERARKVALADWIFGHEKIHEQALLVGQSVAFWGPSYPVESLGRLLSAGREELLQVAERYLRPEAGGVLGWSLPERGSAA